MGPSKMETEPAGQADAAVSPDPRVAIDALIAELELLRVQAGVVVPPDAVPEDDHLRDLSPLGR
jgi:hypothetical protein